MVAAESLGHSRQARTAARRPHTEPLASNRAPPRLAVIGVVRHQVTPCARLKIMLVDVPLE